MPEADGAANSGFGDLEARESFRLAFENAPIGMAIATLELRWVRVNQSLCEILGYSQEQLLSTSVTELTHADDVRHAVDAAARMLAGTASRYETEKRYIHASGKIVWVHLNVSLVKDAEGQPLYFLSQMQDITDRKYAEIGSRLAQGVERAVSRAADLDGALEGFLAEVGEETGWALGQAWLPSSDGERLEPSRARYAAVPSSDALMTLGRHPSFAPGVGLPGRVWSTKRSSWTGDIAADDDFPRADLAARLGLNAAMAVPVLAGDEVVAVIELLGAREADERLLAVVATVGQQLGASIRRKQAEDRLRESELRYRSVSEAASEAIIVADELGTVVSWNRGAETIFGYHQHEALGQPLVLIIPERFREAHLRGLDRRRLGGKSTLDDSMLELTGLRRDGAEFPLELSLASWQTGGRWFFSGIIRDITERKRAEAALTQARDRAMEASELKSRLVATVSHEVRTPMIGILGLTELALSMGLTAEQRQYMETVKRSAEALLRTIDDILDLSKAQAGRLETSVVPFDLDDLVDGVVALLSGQAHRKGIELSFFVHRDLEGPLAGDPGRIRQVLINLVGNAVKFTGGGAVSVRAEPVEPVESEETTTVRFSVADTGIGIPSNMGTALFEPFAQVAPPTDTSQRGTGLGLAISKQLVELMGGQIGFDSQPGVGSTFWFTCPLERGEARLGSKGGAAESEATTAPAGTSTDAAPPAARVLLVEDDGATQMVMQSLLTCAGYDVDTAGTGAQALPMISTGAYDAVLMDYHLPDIDGCEMTRRIRRLESDERWVPVIGVTASTSVQELQHGVASGMDDHLCKPVQEVELRHVLARWVAVPDADDDMGGQGGSPHLDIDRLALLSAAGRAGGPALVAQLITLYRDDARTNLRELRHAVESGDRADVENLAHRLRGSSGNLGAAGIAHLASGVEQAARDDRLADAGPSLRRLEIEARLALATLTDYSRRCAPT